MSYEEIHEVNTLVRNAKNNYSKQLLNESAGNPDSFLSAIKKIYPNKSTSKTINNVSGAKVKLETANGIVSTIKRRMFVLKDLCMEISRKVYFEQN